MSSVQGRSPPSWMVFHGSRSSQASWPGRWRVLRARHGGTGAGDCCPCPRPFCSAVGSGVRVGKMGVPACVTVAGLLDRVPQMGAFHGRSLWSPSAGPEGQNQGVGLEGAFNSLLGLPTAFFTHTAFSLCCCVQISSVQTAPVTLEEGPPS